MMRIQINTIFSVFILVTFSLQLTGQERSVGKVLTYDPPVFSQAGSEAAVDTLYPPVSSTCDLSQLFVFGITGQPGYVTGTNAYSDLEKAQLFPNPIPAEAGITGVLVFFGEKRIVGSADGIVAKIYSQGSNKEPDMLMGTSDTLSIAAVDTNGALTHFTFDPVTTYDTAFFASIVVDATDDTVAIVHTDDGCGLSNAFELWSNNTWHRMDTAWGETDISLEVFVIVDDDFVGLDENMISGKGLDIYPNPVVDELHLNFDEALREDVVLRIKAIDGTSVVERKLDFEQAKTDYSINLNDLASGAHILEVKTSAGLLRKVFIKQ